MMLDSKLCAVAPGTTLAGLQAFETLVGRKYDTVMVYNNASPTWAGLVMPWFCAYKHPSPYAWADWATAPDTSRRLIITQNPCPPAVEPAATWLADGAAGKFAPYFTELATNLVAAGLGNSIIRLCHEANDPAYEYSVSASWTAAQFAQWTATWNSSATAMKAVTGAEFLFDWCINAYYQPIPLADWYPGDDLVDIVGIDTYDAGVPLVNGAQATPAQRWTRLMTQANGIQAVLDFAQLHGKPVSIPEWGLEPAATTAAPGNTGGGDNPTYVEGIAQAVRDNPVAYQSYFYSGVQATLLAPGSGSLAAYQAAFVISE
jgi:Glycosyl hydrolase family 26